MFEKLRELLVPQASANNPQVDPLAMAVCVLLLEAADADEDFADAERAHILTVLHERFTLSSDEAHAHIMKARDLRASSSDLWHFTHVINENCNPEEKLGIIEAVWRVVYADGVLSAHEDYLMHKLGQLLNLNHRQLIDAKLRAKQAGNMSLEPKETTSSGLAI